MASIWCENMLGYLSSDVICSVKRPKTENVQGQISEHVFVPNEGYCAYNPSNLFRNTRSLENWGIFAFLSHDQQDRKGNNKVRKGKLKKYLFGNKTRKAGEFRNSRNIANSILVAQPLKMQDLLQSPSWVILINNYSQKWR